MQNSVPRRRYVWSPAGVLVVRAIGLTYANYQAAGAVVHVDALIRGLLVGIVAQLVDGALGMAYGVTASTFLLATGAALIVVATSVHVAKFFASGASALSHWRLGNVDRHLFVRLLVPGVIGAIIGVYILTSMDGHVLRPLINVYLLVMGIWIIVRAFWQVTLQSTVRGGVILVGLIGAFANAIGGGGWGPIVTTSMMGTGREPRYVVGTVNTVEFFVEMVSGIALILVVNIAAWEAVTGLIFGGMLMAPFAAWVVGRIPRQWLMIMVGGLITALSAWSLVSLYLK